MNIENIKEYINNNWHTVLIVLVVFVALIFIFREKFSEFQQNLPYTSGAGVRLSSIDSSTNRGRSQLQY